MIAKDYILARKIESAVMQLFRTEAECSNRHAGREVDTIIELNDGILYLSEVYPFWCKSRGFGMEEITSEETVSKIEDEFFTRGFRARTWLTPYVHETTLNHFGKRGWTLESCCQFMVKDLADPLEFPIQTTDVRIRDIHHREIPEWAEFITSCFANFGKEYTEHPERYSNFASADNVYPVYGEYRGRIAGAGQLFIYNDVALIIGAGVAEKFRRKGVHSAMIRYRLQKARELGCSLAVYMADAGSGSQINAEKHGFEIAYTAFQLVKSIEQ